jgi:hypothetical protein
MVPGRSRRSRAEVEGVGFAGDEHGRRKPYSLRAARPLEQGCLIGQKRPLKPKDVWTVRVRLQLEGRKRDLAMFNLAIDSKLRDCHLIRVRIDDVRAGGRVRDRARARALGGFGNTGRLGVRGAVARSAAGRQAAARDTRHDRSVRGAGAARRRISPTSPIRAL